MIRPFLLLLSDLIALTASLMIAFGLSRLFCGDVHLDCILRFWSFLAPAVILNLASGLYGGSLFHPGLDIHPVEELRRLTLNCIASFAVFWGWCIFAGNAFPLSWPMLTAAMALSFLMLPSCRFILRCLLRKFHLGFIPSVIAGDAGLARKVFAGMKRDNRCILEIKASSCKTVLADGIRDFT